MKTTKDIIREIRNNPAMGLPGIYLIYRKSDRKPYVGQTKLAIKDRLIQHINNVYVDKESKGIDSAIQKEGADKFEYVVLIPIPEAQTEQLWCLEALKIEEYNSYDKGFNRTRGNHVGRFDINIYSHKHRINDKMVKLIEKELYINFTSAKRVLLVGNFTQKFKNYLEYSECDVVNIIDAYEDFLDNFEREINCMDNKNFDIAISNPPYGKVGGEVTKNIIDNIKYNQFVNIMQVNDYFYEDIHMYVDLSRFIIFKDAFKDARNTVIACKVNRRPILSRDKEEFIIDSFLDPSLTKFFYENKNREHYAIDKAPATGFTVKNAGVWDVNKTVILGYRDMANCVVPRRNSDQYKWNVEKSIDFNYLLQNRVTPTNQQFLISNINFNTEIERDNFVKFMYSDKGYRFYSKLWKSMHISNSIKTIGLIKVDWTREWTVEEILKDYGYTDKEIKEVMDDLDNFMGLDEEYDKDKFNYDYIVVG